MNLRNKQGISKVVTTIAIVVVIVVASAAGYFYYAGSQTTTSSGTLQNVTMGFAGVPDVTDTPGFMLWQTFANQLGLNIHVQYYDGDQTVAAALVAGNIQIGEGGFQAVVSANLAEGNSSGSYPFVVFGTYEATNDFGLVVSNSVKNWSDLAGQPVACSSAGSTSCTFCNLLLSNNGLSANQINCAPFGSTTTRYKALLDGKAVGVIVEPFYMVAAVETGNYHIIATIPAVVPNLLFSSLYTSRAYAAAHPDVVLKIEEATLLADRWAHNESAWIQKEQEDFPGTNATIAGAAWSIWMAMNMWAPNGGLSEQALNYSVNFFVSIGKVKTYLAPSYWSTLDYQNQALSALGTYTACPVLKGCPDPTIPKLKFQIPGVSSALFPKTGFSGGGSLTMSWDSTSIGVTG